MASNSPSRRRTAACLRLTLNERLRGSRTCLSFGILALVIVIHSSLLMVRQYRSIAYYGQLSSENKRSKTLSHEMEANLISSLTNHPINKTEPRQPKILTSKTVTGLPNHSKNEIIKPKRSLEFVHIPKTGGSAIEYAAAKANVSWGLCHWFERPLAGPGCMTKDWDHFKVTRDLDRSKVDYSWEIWHTPPSWLKNHSPYVGNDLFAVVRDPYDRFISEFYCPYNGLNAVDFSLPASQRNFSDPMAPPDLKPGKPGRWKPETPESLNKFLMDRLRWEVKWTAHYLPQAEFVYDTTGKQVVDHVLRFENLGRDFADLMAQYNLSIFLNETTNKGAWTRGKRMTVDDLYPETIRRINEIAKRDFEAFGYEMHTTADDFYPKSIGNFYDLPKHNVHKTSDVPSVAFLFMTVGSVNEGLWERWFPLKDPRYSIFVHSIPSKTTIPLGPFFCPHAIPAVPVKWYELHDGMVQILHHAFHKDLNAKQFVFVSESNMPLVSFDEVYRRLVVDNGGGERSRVCWENRKDAPIVWNHTAPKLRIDVKNVRKAEMWSSLSRSHVEILLEQRVRLDKWNHVFLRTRNETGGANSTVGAPDECLFPTMLNIYGNSSQFVSCDKGLGNCCTTKAMWWRTEWGKVYTLDKSLLSDRCSPDWPCTLTTLHEAGLQYLVQEGFLFLRKVPENTTIQSLKDGTLHTLNDALFKFHKGWSLNTTDRDDFAALRTNKKSSDFKCPAPID